LPVLLGLPRRRSVVLRRIVVSDYGVFIGCKGGRVVIKKKGEKILEEAAANISQVLVLTRGVSLSSAFLRLALRHGIDLVILSDSGVPLGKLSRLKKGGVRVRKEQYKAQGDWRGVHLAKQMAKAKIVNQRNLLRQLARHRASKSPEIAKRIMNSVYDMKQHVINVERISASNTDEARAKIMFEEARAADKYWTCVKLALSDVVDFPGRKKRFDRPTDPVNVLLNYGYYLLASTVWLAIDCTPLDPYVGFLHADSSRRPALVMDLMEEFRQPVVDRAVFNVVRNGVEGLCDEGKLTVEGRKKLVKEFFGRLRSKITFRGRCQPVEYHILLQARRICHFLIGKTAEYTPFTAR